VNNEGKTRCSRQVGFKKLAKRKLHQEEYRFFSMSYADKLAPNISTAKIVALLQHVNKCEFAVV
jgi:hypothetical protein